MHMPSGPRSGLKNRIVPRKIASIQPVFCEAICCHVKSEKVLDMNGLPRSGTVCTTRHRPVAGHAL